MIRLRVIDLDICIAVGLIWAATLLSAALVAVALFPRQIAGWVLGW